MSERLASELNRYQTEERERALRALLMRPLMTAADPNFGAVRRHAEALRTWLARETGWVLRVERDCARLYKIPADLADGTRGAPGFNRRHYILMCLACAILERADSQVTLRTLGERLLDASADPELAARGFVFSLQQMHERRELVHVCRYLIALGVLHRLAGEEEAYVSHGGDALYDIQRRALAALLACTRGPSTLGSEAQPSSFEERLAEITAEYVPDSMEGKRTAVRHGLARRLLDDPVVYFDELSDEQCDYLTNQRGVMAGRLCTATGLHPELRAEGSALVDHDGELTDAALPAEGTVAHATLLVAEHLAQQASLAPGTSVAVSDVAAFVRRVADRYGRYWRKAAREAGAEIELAEQTLRGLAALKLVVYEDENAVKPRPALARFAVGQPQVRDITQPSLPLA